MSNITTNVYSDFKELVKKKHFRDIFFFDNGAGAFIAYAITDDGFIFSTGNINTQPVSFVTDFPNATQLAGSLSLS
jgi:hypothetical protein